ncbi:Coenzyme F420 hydrogenase/dehydrogenase, beta subunit C-terminal domain [Parabacteroides sp. Marseille-P3160]|uniref:Coenzyme F420 hydrogenase/dehydrogenase, beta subunit C-terminal domain n=1 Tax=Parabacteroides sp. Marseille-P3160 TaxID=1917887 RepID=UPI0009BC0EC7|nr:Coenzyme F420 hydrogenase/dehydrogenase, beta subunit C-terminal domain [Parabacteroides sp. Marseille-P3160]
MDIKTIDKNNLCLGCGICESLAGRKSISMKLQDDGFYHPVIQSLSNEKQNIITNLCPGTNIINQNKFGIKDNIWGKILKLSTGYSTENDIRERGSSGGVISAIAIYLLENKIVDGILQVGSNITDYTQNKLKISRNREDVLNCASSRYAPALVFNEIFDILKNNDEKYCFIGKPCDVAALNNILKKFPQYKIKIKYKIAFFCAGMPSFNGTEKAINILNAEKPVYNLYYRGNGWPGYFSFKDNTGKTYQMSYKESWGNILGKHIHYRCKICPDGIGLQADIVVGDAWETVDGYPDFTEKEGKSLIIARNIIGFTLLNTIEASGKIITEEISIDKLKKIQPTQFDRRKIVLARLGALLIKKRIILNFKNMKLLYNVLTISPRRFFNQFKGTIKRT